MMAKPFRRTPRSAGMVLSCGARRMATCAGTGFLCRPPWSGCQGCDFEPQSSFLGSVRARGPRREELPLAGWPEGESGQWRQPREPGPTRTGCRCAWGSAPGPFAHRRPGLHPRSADSRRCAHRGRCRLASERHRPAPGNRGLPREQSKPALRSLDHGDSGDVPDGSSDCDRHVASPPRPSCSRQSGSFARTVRPKWRLRRSELFRP